MVAVLDSYYFLNLGLDHVHSVFEIEYAPFYICAKLNIIEIS